MIFGFGFLSREAPIKSVRPELVEGSLNLHVECNRPPFMVRQGL